jgi:catalase
MAQSRRSPAGSMIGLMVLIAAVIAGCAAAFAYTAGWFSLQRLTPDKFVDALTPPTGQPLGYRRNHAKGICFTGVFEAKWGRNGALTCSGFYPRSVSCPRTLQSRHC